jgi:hypothetical protein
LYWGWERGAAKVALTEVGEGKTSKALLKEKEVMVRSL